MGMFILSRVRRHLSEKIAKIVINDQVRGKPAGVILSTRVNAGFPSLQSLFTK